MQIKLTKVYVDEHDKALRFYTEVLGLTKKADFGNSGYRWLTVASGLAKSNVRKTLGRFCLSMRP